MDGWVCQDCKSINTPRSSRCYGCNLPHSLSDTTADRVEALTGGPVSTGPGSVDRPGGAGAGRHAERPTVDDFRSSLRRSRVLIVLLGASIGLGALSTAMLLARGGTLGLVIDILSFDLRTLGTTIAIGILQSILGVVTAVAWFAWFDRVLRNVPPLTGAWPDSGRVGAIGWWLVPIVGLIKAPRIVGDVYNRLRVPGSPGLWLLALWALTWIGGTVGPAVVSRVLGFLPLPIELHAQLGDLVTLAGQVAWVTAGVAAVALVLAIEHASAVRAALGGAGRVPVELPEEFDPVDAAVSLAIARGQGASASEDPDRELEPPDPTGWRAAFAAAGLPPDTRPTRGIRRASAVMVAVAVVGVVAGAAVAGPRSDRTLQGAVAAFSARLVPTPAPLRLVVQPPRANPLPRPTPTPAPVEVAVAERLVDITFAEDYRGRMDMTTTMQVGSGPVVRWTMTIARAEDLEWSRSVVRGAAGTETDEIVLADRSVFERSGSGRWKERPRQWADQPTDPLLGLKDPDDLRFQGTVREAGRTRYAYGWPDPSRDLTRLLTRSLGGAEVLRAEGSVVAETDGTPVRMVLVYDLRTDAGRAHVELRFRYREVGGRFTIRSPLEGDPVVPATGGGRA